MNHRKFMKLAIEAAHKNKQTGGYGVGALVVKDGEVISTGENLILQDIDPTAHAEIIAIRRAAKKLKNRYLYDCWLYSSYEPCSMCASAAVWARMKGIVFSARCDDSENPYSWIIKYTSSEIIERGIPTLEIVPDVLREEGLELVDFQPLKR